MRNLGKMREYFPILDWGLNYKRDHLTGDLTAGIIVASLLIPQGMAYAILAGLPPEVGLYASIFPQIVYGFLGTASMLSVAPVAVDSLMVATAVSAIATENTPEYWGYALTLALLVGIIELLIGIFRLGFIANFLSQAVISGFISAAAILIGFSQLKHLLGIKIPQTESFFSTVIHIIKESPNLNLVTFSLGIISLALLLYFNRGLGKHLKSQGIQESLIIPITKSAPLMVVIGSSILVGLLHLDQLFGVKVIGEIPKGFPPFTIPNFDLNNIQLLGTSALAISFVGFMEAFSVGQFLASKKRKKVEANQELIALGASNITAAFTGGYPITGGLSRSVVNFSAGANTALASIITALFLMLTVLFFTPLFYYLPQTSLAAIILVAVGNLLDFATLKRLWNYNKLDGITWFSTFISVLLTSAEQGIILGVVISLVLHLSRTSKPHIAVLGRLENTEHFRNILRHPVTTSPHILAIRIDESLYFVNTKYLEDYLLKLVTEQKEVEYLLLVCSGINSIDGSALETLQRLIEDLHQMKIEFYLSEVKGPIFDQLEKVGFVDKLGRDRIFLSTDQAIKELSQRVSL
ncbi:SulP family inorganic anion transporter [Planktothrix agardhii]|uniref:SulP family inorganic anion transporter n=2 Tax=Planktothrix agardhii TaxID=1160 RepID=UPI00241ECEA7|nr:solute carrier family 26 protein [Planktothrix agardhii]MCF3580290.1 solute carrier family 26 protein [Planktothrix agardhii 1811]